MYRSLNWCHHAIFEYVHQRAEAYVQACQAKPNDDSQVIPEMGTETLAQAVQSLIQGKYQFSPMRQFKARGETIRIWTPMDRFMVNALYAIIRKSSRAVLSKNCYHTRGPYGVKQALSDVEGALADFSYQYAIRIDIKSYYASMSHSVLLKALRETYHDPRLLHYFEAVVQHAVDDDAHVFLPEKGIPRASSLSPFFGAFYLLPLDRAFEDRKNCRYFRFMDDILILFRNARSFKKGKKAVFRILRSLKLELSARKSWMGKLTHGFHFLGIHFSAAKPEVKTHPMRISVHPRTSARALDKVKVLLSDAGDPANAQRYLSAWARWWSKSVNPLSMVDFINAWITHTANRDPTWLWMGALLNLVNSIRGSDLSCVVVNLTE